MIDLTQVFYVAQLALVFGVVFALVWQIVAAIFRRIGD